MQSNQCTAAGTTLSVSAAASQTHRLPLTCHPLFASVSSAARVLVISEIGGLREAFSAAGLEPDEMAWFRASADATSPDLQECLQKAEVIVGEPKGATLKLLATAPALRWFQATFAGCNAMLDSPESFSHFVTTRLGGVLGNDLAEYVVAHVLALERSLSAHVAAQRKASWPDDETRRRSYRRLPTLTLGVLGLGDIGRAVARRLGPVLRGH